MFIISVGIVVVKRTYDLHIVLLIILCLLTHEETSPFFQEKARLHQISTISSLSRTNNNDEATSTTSSARRPHRRCLHHLFRSIIINRCRTNLRSVQRSRFSMHFRRLCQTHWLQGHQRLSRLRLLQRWLSNGGRSSRG